MKICSKKYLHEPTSYTTEIPEVSLAFKHTKKVEIWSFIRARIRFRIRSQKTGSGPRRPDPVPDVRIRIRPKRSGSDRIRLRIRKHIDRAYFHQKNFRKKLGKKFMSIRTRTRNRIRTFSKVGSGSGQKLSGSATLPAVLLVYGKSIC
jgi:hypothetical protein